MPNFIDTPGLWLFELHVFVEGFLLKEAADVRGAVIEVLVHELRLQSYNISIRKLAPRDSGKSQKISVECTLALLIALAYNTALTARLSACLKCRRAINTLFG